MGCSDEVLTIVSMLSANHHIFIRPKRRQRDADAHKMRFNDYKGDHITLVRACRESLRQSHCFFSTFFSLYLVQRVHGVAGPRHV